MILRGLKIVCCVAVLMTVASGYHCQVLGGNTETTNSITDAQNDIMSVSDLATPERRTFLERLFATAKLVKTFSQVVAGTNKTYLFQTSRGFECFKVYSSFDGGKSLIRYTRGADQNQVLADCRSFYNMQESHQVANSVFASGSN